MFRKSLLKALGLLSTISAYFAFLLAFLIVCRCFHDVLVWRNKASNPDVLCSVVGRPGHGVCIVLYVKKLKKEVRRHTHTHTQKQSVMGRFMSHEWRVHISMSNGYHMNNSTSAVFPFTFIFNGNHECRVIFAFYTLIWIDFTAWALWRTKKLCRAVIQKKENN